jgi:hypothetical protein
MRFFTLGDPRHVAFVFAFFLSASQVIADQADNRPLQKYPT